MMSDMEKHDWPVGKEDIELLDKEIQQAEVFLQQSKDLRKASEEVVKPRFTYLWFSKQLSLRKSDLDFLKLLLISVKVQYHVLVQNPVYRLYLSTTGKSYTPYSLVKIHSLPLCKVPHPTTW